MTNLTQLKSSPLGEGQRAGRTRLVGDELKRAGVALDLGVEAGEVEPVDDVFVIDLAEVLVALGREEPVLETRSVGSCLSAELGGERDAPRDPRVGVRGRGRVGKVVHCDQTRDSVSNGFRIVRSHSCTLRPVNSLPATQFEHTAGIFSTFECHDRSSLRKQHLTPLLRGLRSHAPDPRPRETRLTATVFLPVAALEATGLRHSRRESVARALLEDRGGLRSWRRRNDDGTRVTGDSCGRGKRDGWLGESGGVRSFELAAGGGAALSLGRGQRGVRERTRRVCGRRARVDRYTRRRQETKQYLALESSPLRTCKGDPPKA